MAVSVDINAVWPKWIVRQGSACIFVQASTAEAAIETAARRIGPTEGWRVGPDVAHEVFARGEYPEEARPGDYSRSVIIAS